MTDILDKIDYETLVDEAMRSVVKRSLESIINDRLPANHHFYISFFTHSPGVMLSKPMKDRYPEEITIVLQHQFEDLLVEEDRFSVMLTFNGTKERVIVPYMALTSFTDPNVKFALRFKRSDATVANKDDVTLENNEAVKEVLRQTSQDNVVALDTFRKSSAIKSE